MTDRELMQQALEALGLWATGRDMDAVALNDLILRLEAALAEPKQEPFCYHDGRNIVGKEYADHSDVFPLYTAPPQRKPLTDEEIEEAFQQSSGVDEETHIRFARAIEAAHGIKGEA